MLMYADKGRVSVFLRLSASYFALEKKLTHEN